MGALRFFEGSRAEIKFPKEARASGEGSSSPSEAETPMASSSGSSSPELSEFSETSEGPSKSSSKSTSARCAPRFLAFLAGPFLLF